MAVGTLDPRRGLVWQDAPMSQDEIDRQRALADAVLRSSQSTAPIGDWTQGAAQVVNALGGVLRERRLDKAQTDNTNTNASLMASLLGSNASPDAVAAPGAAPGAGGSPTVAAAGPISPGAPNDIQNQFIDTVRQGGLTNPVALAAVAATGKAESGYDPKNAGGIWNDGANNAGGIMSWNGPRLANLQKFAGGTNGTPQQQGQFFLQENPDLITKLNGAKSVDEAQHLMNNAWAFKGYDQPGNSQAAHRLALAQGYLPQFASQQPSASGAAPAQVASLDPSSGMGSIPPVAVAAGQPPQGMAIPVPSPRPDQQVAQAALDPATASPSQMMGALGIDPQASAPAQPASAPAPAMAPQQQVAQALVNSPGRCRAAACRRPFALRRPVSPAVIAALTSKSASPATKQVAMALLQRQQTQAAQQQQFVLDQKKSAYEQQLKQSDPQYQATLQKAQYEAQHLGQVSPDTQATLDAQQRAAKAAADNAWIQADHQQDLKQSDPLEQANVAKTNMETANANQTPDIKEYNFAKSTGYTGSFAQYQLDMKQAARPTTTINTGDNSSAFGKKADEEAATRFGGYISDGNAASRTLGDVQQLADLGTQITTGKGAQAVAALGPYAEALGIDIKGLPAAQAYQSIISRVAPQMRPTGAGSSSDTDVKMFLNGLPSLGNSPGGNQIITQTLAAVQQQKIEAAKIAQQAMLPKEQGGITWQEAEGKIRDLGNPYETFNKYRQTLSQNGTQQLPSDSLTVPTTIPGVTIRRKN
jgi:hypothetical protein